MPVLPAGRRAERRPPMTPAAPARTLRLVREVPTVRLLDLITRDLPADLVDGAACGADPELHTGPDLFDHESDQERAAREDVAKSVCAECPGRLDCLAAALRIRPETGVWAGLTADELAELTRPGLAS
ncbi:hypothetical protein GT755_09825 [Herbidospora sp. NEAU-GS84]|uniref:4Fe-4S Wbl-type domain-containing protein n=1 Tax=Herbidospora solisilvae TaxID=2696284 RepID=A0A7C9JBM6_9ACTN|nr:WhiB family transcriptional regulator [Herbidospora solisilvae]NAS21981.1 hypothetical protein [Herbidospora solisilvae]